MDGTNNDDDVHRRVPWMVPADVVILEFLHSARDARGQPAIQTPNTVALNTGYSNRHASARLQVLADRGVVERTGSGKYRLTELGEAAVTNEILIEEFVERTGDKDETDENGSNG